MPLDDPFRANATQDSAQHWMQCERVLLVLYGPNGDSFVGLPRVPAGALCSLVSRLVEHGG